MSVLDSISETVNEDLEALYVEVEQIRLAYDLLSKIWERYPNPEMARELDKLLEVWESAKAWHMDLERYASNLDGE